MQGLLKRIRRASDTTKRDSFGALKKKILPRIFLTFSAKRALCALGHIFNKVKRGVVQKSETAGP